MADLISLSDYKEYKKITSSTRDGKIQALITQVSALVESYCARKFVEYSSSPGVTEWFDSNTDKVQLKHFPVIAVNSVSVSTDGGLTQTELTQDDPDRAGFYVDLENGVVMTQKTGNKFNDGYYYDIPYRSLEINYFAGYTELPADLELAVLDIVAYYEDQENKPTQTLMGGTIENALPYTANSFPPHIRRILDLYRYSPG
jgi:hypothetical protein